MIYLDTSVALAELLAEAHTPPPDLWEGPVFSSRLLEYELSARLNARGLEASHRALAEGLLARVSLVELSPLVLERALRPFPREVRTLDALHLATLEWLGRGGGRPRLATYDGRMRQAAEALGFEVVPLAR